MKFLMNGCLLLATADGSTVEIIEEIGVDNMVCLILCYYQSVRTVSVDKLRPKSTIAKE